MKLLTAAGNGNGTAIRKEQWANRHLDQFCTLFVWGTFGGATVTLEISPDGTNWFDTGVSITAKGCQNVEFRASLMRAVVTGGVSSEIEAEIL